MRRVRNYCADQEDLVSLTRIALEQVGSTKGFKELEQGLRKTVEAEENGKRREYGYWEASYSENNDQVVIFVTTNRGCNHLWRFSWPDLMMVGYEVIACNCTSQHRQARRPVRR